jgi:AcrR family transcriptional regulator
MRTNNKNLIIKESIKLFYTQGYEKTTIRQIAKACNMAHPSIFNHFKNKSAIGDVMFYRFVRGTVLMTQRYIRANGIDVNSTHMAMVFYWAVHYFFIKNDSRYFKFIMDYYTFQKADETKKKDYFDQLFRRLIPKSVEIPSEKKTLYTRLIIHAMYVLSLSYYESRLSFEETVIEHFYMFYSIFKIDRGITDSEISEFIQTLQIEKYIVSNLLEDVLLSDFGRPYQNLDIDNLFPT